MKELWGRKIKLNVKSKCKTLLSLQNALAATAAPFQGQYSGFEAYPYATAATGEILLNSDFISNHKS